MSTDTVIICTRHKRLVQGSPQDCKHSITVADNDRLTNACSRLGWVLSVSSSLNLSPAHVPSVHTFVNPPGQAVSNRVLLNAVQSEVSMCGWRVRARHQRV